MLFEESGALDVFLEAPAVDPASGDEVGPAPLTPEEAAALDQALRAEVFVASSDAGLGLLVKLAKQGGFDPWDVDIVTLTDRYLEALDEHLDARELGQVARLIFYAAALVHLKAQALAQREAERKAAAELAAAELALLDSDDEYGDGHFGPRLRPDDLPLVYPDFMSGPERGGISLAPRERPPRKRGLSLVDLIVALKSYDERLAEREADLEEDLAFDADIAYDECVGGSHQDDLDADIANVRLELWQQLGQEDPDADPEARTTLEAVQGPRTRAATYLALLFLSHDEEVVLHQEVFYGELKISRGRHFGEIRAGVERNEDEDEAGDGFLDDDVELQNGEEGEDSDSGEEAELTEEELEVSAE